MVYGQTLARADAYELARTFAAGDRRRSHSQGNADRIARRGDQQPGVADVSAISNDSARGWAVGIRAVLAGAIRSAAALHRTWSRTSPIARGCIARRSRRADTEFYKPLDYDDQLLPDYLDRAVAAMDERKLDVYGCLLMTLENGEFSERKWPHKPLETMFTGNSDDNMLPHSSVLMRTEICRARGKLSGARHRPGGG